MSFELVNLRLSQHAAISYQHYPRQMKPLAQLVHLIHHRGGITGVAGVDLDGDGTTVAIGHQAVDDDGQPFLPVAIVPILRQGQVWPS